MSRAAIELLILRRLRTGPVYIRAFHAAMPVVRDLGDRGLIRRVAPPNNRAKLCVELTDAGARLLARAS